MPGSNPVRWMCVIGGRVHFLLLNRACVRSGLSTNVHCARVEEPDRVRTLCGHIERARRSGRPVRPGAGMA